MLFQWPYDALFALLKAFSMVIHPLSLRVSKRFSGTLPPLPGTIKCSTNGAAKGFMRHAGSSDIFWDHRVVLVI